MSIFFVSVCFRIDGIFSLFRLSLGGRFGLLAKEAFTKKIEIVVLIDGLGVGRGMFIRTNLRINRSFNRCATLIAPLSLGCRAFALGRRVRFRANHSSLFLLLLLLIRDRKS